MSVLGGRRRPGLRLDGLAYTDGGGGAIEVAAVDAYAPPPLPLPLPPCTVPPPPSNAARLLMVDAPPTWDAETAARCCASRMATVAAVCPQPHSPLKPVLDASTDAAVRRPTECDP